MKKIKAAVIGGGWFGQFHTDNLLQMEDVELAAFATGNSARLAELSAKQPNARAYSDQKDLIAEERGLDALIVCVPPDSRNGIEKTAAENGIHLFMEKPLGVDLEYVLGCEKAINESGIICSVGYQTRYNLQADAIKAQVRDDEIGTVVAKWMGIMPETPWWRIKARSGGQFIEQVTHMVDLLRYFFGDVKSVYSAGRTDFIRGVPNYDVEDASATVLTFESGLLATVTCGCFVNPENAGSEIRIEMYGKRRHVFYEWDTLARWENKLESSTRYFGNEFHFPALRTFIDAVKNRDSSKIRSTYSDAVKTFKTTWAADLSVKKGAAVELRSL